MYDQGIANPLTVHYIDTVLYGVEQSFVIEELQSARALF